MTDTAILQQRLEEQGVELISLTLEQRDAPVWKMKIRANGKAKTVRGRTIGVAYLNAVEAR